MGGVGRKAAEQVGGRGRRNGEVAVGALDHAAAYVERRAVPNEGLAGLGEGLRIEGVDGGAPGDDVDDGVDGADLVEVDLVDGDVVDPGFGGAEEIEGLEGEVFDGFGEGGRADEVADGGEGAAMGVLVWLVLMRVGLVCVGLVCVGFGVGVFVRVGVAGLVKVLRPGVVLVVVFVVVLLDRGVGGSGGGCGGFGVGVPVLVRMCFGEVAVLEDVDLCGGDAGAVDLFDLEGGTEVERGDDVVQDLGRDADVDQGSEKHVAGDAGEAV